MENLIWCERCKRLTTGPSHPVHEEGGLEEAIQVCPECYKELRNGGVYLYGRNKEIDYVITEERVRAPRRRKHKSQSYIRGTKGGWVKNHEVLACS